MDLPPKLQGDIVERTLEQNLRDQSYRVCNSLDISTSLGASWIDLEEPLLGSLGTL